MYKGAPYNLLIGLSVMAAVSFYFSRQWWLLILLSTIILLAFFVPLFGKGLKLGMDWLALSIGKVISVISLFIFYFLLFVPVSLITRLFSKDDPIRRKPVEESNFREANRKWDKDSLLNPW